jgi:hypothetical protein
VLFSQTIAWDDAMQIFKAKGAALLADFAQF